jgi:chromosome segregation ATPase
MEQVFDNVKEYVEKSEFQKEYYLNEIQKLADEQDAMKHKLEAENAFRKCTEAMTDMLDEENEELTEALNTACDEADRLEVTRSVLQDEVRELNDIIGKLEVEAQDARRSFTALQLAVSILVFLYGMLYGNYFKC